MIESSVATALTGMSNASGDDFSFTMRCGCASCMKSFQNTAYKNGTDAFPIDGVGGDLRIGPSTTPLIITADAQPGDATSIAMISVDGPDIVATIDTIGDQDFFRVNLVAGQTYEIGQYLKTGGPNAVPLVDAYFELIGPDGTVITQADGGGPNTPRAWTRC